MAVAARPDPIPAEAGEARPRSRPRRLLRRSALAFGAVLGAVALYLVTTFVQVVLAGREDDTRQAGAIVVMGAAQYNGEPSGALAGRLQHALELWEAGYAPVIVVTGGNQPGDVTTEGLASFTYLRERGVPEEALLVEVDAADTYEAVSASELILRERGIPDALVVSDPYHNLRLRGIAREVGLVAAMSAAPSSFDRNASLRETAAVAAGRIIGYRRLSQW
ncbi:MAG: YdcF family protein [Acidimicrobiia bacterium]|nr:YdcF family protein [Acidimicrobiia bacterium]